MYLEISQIKKNFRRIVLLSETRSIHYVLNHSDMKLITIVISKYIKRPKIYIITERLRIEHHINNVHHPLKNILMFVISKAFNVRITPIITNTIPHKVFPIFLIITSIRADLLNFFLIA